MAFLGMRGTGDWATDERPKGWRQGILRLYPNGAMPLTAILSKLGSKKVPDAEFNWWEKMLPTQGGAVTGRYTNSGLDSAYVSGGTAGQIVYIKAAEATAEHFRVGHIAQLRCSTDPTMTVVVRVVGVTLNGASSALACKLLEDDDNGTSTDISDANLIRVTGSAHPEGGGFPDAVAYDPSKRTNYTQIFRTPLMITRTARETSLRTADSYQEAKREALELHGIEMEKAFMFGIPTENVGENGKKIRTTGGCIHFIKTYNATNGIGNFVTDDNALWNGKTWEQAGHLWLNYRLQLLYKYGSSDKLALCGAGTIGALNRLAESLGNINMTPGETSYGIQVVKWISPHGILNLKLAPLMSIDDMDDYSMVILEPARLGFRYITDTTFVKDTGNTGVNRIDGTAEEFLTEGGLEMSHAMTMGYLTGFGSNNGN